MERWAESVEQRRLLLPAAGAAALLLVFYSVVREYRVNQVAIGIVFLTVCVFAARPLRRAVSRNAVVPWSLVVGGLIAVMFLVPMTRYALPGGLPFQVDPFRLCAGLVIAAWLASLLVDPRVRFSASSLDAPLLVFLLAVLGSVAVNGDRLQFPDADAGVFKVVLLLLTCVALFYLVVSVVRTRTDVDRLVRLTVACGTIVGFFAVVESQTGVNIFNHLGPVLPSFQFVDPETASNLTDDFLQRGGGVRVYGSAEHPIALAAALVMVLPLGMYLAHRHSAKWWLAVAVTGLGALTTISRTAVVMAAVALLVLGVLKPWLLARLLPIALVGLVVVFLALPSAVQSLKTAFSPPGGLLGEQGETVAGNPRANGRLADIVPSINETLERPFLGLGFGTRSFEPDNFILDNQWLVIFLETGLIGGAALLWVFGRVLRRLVRESRKGSSADGDLCAALAASIAAYGAGMAFFDSFSFAQVTYLFFVVLALSAVMLALQSESREVAKDSEDGRWGSKLSGAEPQPITPAPV